MENKIKLNMLPIGERGRVMEIKASGTLRRRLFDLGLIENTIVKSLHISPARDPIAYEIRDAVIALRSEEAQNVVIENIGGQHNGFN